MVRNGALPPPRSGALVDSPLSLAQCKHIHNIVPRNALGHVKPQQCGILTMEVYSPHKFCTQEDMENHHSAPGKFTKGLAQDQLGFVGEDEDAVSMCLTACWQLMVNAEKSFGITWDDIGRLEVGTETLTDRSKTIKTHLMSMFVAH